MQDQDRPAPTDPIELDRETCLELLRSARIGRVIYTDSALPAAQPVAFTVDGEEIVFRTDGAGKLLAAARDVVVGFQADDIDATTHSGWSVLGIGTAYEVLEPDRLATLRAVLPGACPSGHTISIPLQHLTGRRLGAARADGHDRGDGHHA